MANRTMINTKMLSDSRLLRLSAMFVMLGMPLAGAAHAQQALPPIQPAAQPQQSEPEPEATAEPVFPEGTVSFSAFAEPMELTTLIDLVGDSLNINIVIRGTPEGEVVFNAPIEVPKSQLIDLLDAMLDQYGFTITYEQATQFYVVQPSSEIKPVFGDQLATTRIIETPNIKPSLLVGPLNATLAGPNQSTGGAGNAIQAVDELGVLIINSTARDIRRIEAMVEQLISIDRDQEFIRFELNHLAAPTALNRVVGLAGGSADSSRANMQQNNRNPQGNNQQGAVSLTGSSLTNIYERITIDPQGNALIFKGTRKEIDRVRDLLAVIDVPNTLEPKNYFAGSSAAQIADIAKRRGLGEIIQIEAQQTNQFNQFQFRNRNTQQPQEDEAGRGGPVMVVDPTRGNIIYYGTPEQQAQLAALLAELRTEDERVVIREYQLNHTDALTVTDLLNAIITGEQQTGDSALLPGGTNRNRARTFINGIPINQDGETGMFNPDQISVIADEFNNQVVVRAPVVQQENLERLIGRLDQQRSQVYIEAMIVSITDNEDFTLAFESQLNRGEFGIGTNFGLSSRDNFTDPKAVSAGLGGLTTAIINSDYIPLIINATQTNTDLKILSTPQLLVNDNQESEIVSVSEEPFTEVSQADNSGNNLVGFGGFEEAGTTLRVTPSISDGGFLRLEYFIELSNFTAASGTEGSPPPRDTNTLEGSITVPSNATVVLGGITVDDVRDTIIKVPLLGDIPLVGELFRRTNKVNNSSRLYVFLTPRIMTDPNFNDLKLFSQGPQNQMQVDGNTPEMQPEIIGSSSGYGPTSSLPRVDRPENNGPAEQINDPDTSPGAGAPSMEPEQIEVSEVNQDSGS